MAGSKVLCIELGDTIKIAEVDYLKADPKIYKTAIFDLEAAKQGANDDVGLDEKGFIHGIYTLAGILESKIKELGFSNNKVVFSIAARKILSRTILFPNVRRDLIKAAIKSSSNDYFFVEPDDYVFSYSIIDEIPGKQLCVMAYAMPKMLVKSYIELADAAHLKLVALEYTGNAQFQVLAKKVQPSNTATTYIAINDNNAVVSILKDGNLVRQYVMGYDKNRISSLILDVRSIEKSYYKNNREVQINPNIYVFGKGALSEGMLELLSKEFGKNVEMLTSIEGINLPENCSKDEAVQMYTLIGAGVDPVGFEIEGKGGVKRIDLRKPIIYIIMIIYVAINLFIRFLTRK